VPTRRHRVLAEKRPRRLVDEDDRLVEKLCAESIVGRC
jgi:hypothetical protein